MPKKIKGNQKIALTIIFDSEGPLIKLKTGSFVVGYLFSCFPIKFLMRRKLFMLLILTCPMMGALALPTDANSSLVTTNKLAFEVAKTASRLKDDAGDHDVREPRRNSVRRSSSRRRNSRKWKRYLRTRTIKAKPAVKFEVPTHGSVMTGVAMTGNIEKWKGHLPWPVSSGTVSMRFGLYEVLKGINHNSIGITIETTPGMPVTAVFGGYVQNVFTVDEKPVVMIRHGKYFTTYSGLTVASVSKGEPVTTGQIFGTGCGRRAA